MATAPQWAAGDTLTPTPTEAMADTVTHTADMDGADPWVEPAERCAEEVAAVGGEGDAAVLTRRPNIETHLPRIPV